MPPKCDEVQVGDEKWGVGEETAGAFFFVVMIHDDVVCCFWDFLLLTSQSFAPPRTSLFGFGRFQASGRGPFGRRSWPSDPRARSSYINGLAWLSSLYQPNPSISMAPYPRKL